MRYEEYSYLYPPRPEAAIQPKSLDYYEKLGWVAQYKKNGTNTVIWISPDKKIILRNRHATHHRAWQITKHLEDEIVRLFPDDGWYVFCAEIMHSKTPTIKDTLYIYDLVVWGSELLLGSTFMERQKLLDSILLTNVEAYSHYICDTQGKIWYPKLVKSNFRKVFDSIKEPKIDEGLVLKNPDGKLSLLLRPNNNNDWQVKCRHPHKNYNF